MRKPTINEILTYGSIAIVICAVLMGWEAIVTFLGILLTAIVPLVLGAAIAYVISIPTKFFERHFLPNSESKFVKGIRRPVALAVTVLLVLTGLFLLSSTLIPALIEAVSMVQKNGRQFVENIIAYPIFNPVRSTVQEFLDGDLMQGLESMDMSGLVKGMFGGTVGNITTQLFSVVSTIMTTFFGIFFSFILLTDTSDIGNKVLQTMQVYVGEKRMQRIALVLGVTDSSFHNFIVRQSIEALILGTVGTLTLLVLRFRYALGIGVLMGIVALVPIVGYPVGLVLGAFIVVINSPWKALVFVFAVALAQMLEATFLLPCVGDPRTVLPPVWVTVAVTIGGGVAGFVGMLVAIPVAATIRQLTLMDVSRRLREAGLSDDSDV
ncbi:MAG: AI-2E family transporter [Atopobiaceae bacterium]|nr:AI-2E family transporter [Atopobiaceae bacterium]